SSAMKTRSIASGLRRPVRHRDLHHVALARDARVDARLDVEKELQPLADVLERHAVAGAVRMLLDVRVLDAREDARAAPLDAHHHAPLGRPRLTARLDPG